MRRAFAAFWVSMLGLVAAASAEAHVPDAYADAARGDTAVALGVALPVVISAALYFIGLGRVQRRRATGRSVCFVVGLLTLTLALLGPLDRWSATSFAFHMTQHEVLMLVAAPLLVVGRPLPLFLWAFPRGIRGSLGRVTRSAPIARTWGVLNAPITAWLLHAIVLWGWHTPALFDAALRSTAVHDLQHVTFLLSALIFWGALMEQRSRDHQGAAVLYLFTTTVHTGVLGALLTFTSHPWYATYREIVPQWPFSPLEDQQLGGLIMWIPASMVYVAVGLSLLARWIQASDPSMNATAATPKSSHSLALPRMDPRN
jgi:putative membrane protein